MACIYIYKNHTFNSENELDDFIMDLLPFESKYGDLVFQVTVEQTNVIDKVNEIYLTEIDEECNDATVYFPKFNKNLYDKEILSENKENDINYKHVLYRRK